MLLFFEKYVNEIYRQQKEERKEKKSWPKNNFLSFTLSRSNVGSNPQQTYRFELCVELLCYTRKNKVF